MELQNVKNGLCQNTGETWGWETVFKILGSVMGQEMVLDNIRKNDGVRVMGRAGFQATKMVHFRKGIIVESSLLIKGNKEMKTTVPATNDSCPDSPS